MYTLVVVDMQPGFNDANDAKVSTNCEREIKKAVEDHADIVFVEFLGYGATLPNLTKLVEGYERHGVISKNRADGSHEVHTVVSDRNFMISCFRVVGVCTDCCVYYTTAGLRNRYPNSFIEVVADACNSYSHERGLEYIRKLDRVDVI